MNEKLFKLFDKINKNLDQISEKEKEKAFQMYEQVKRDFAQMIALEKNAESSAE
ncbi:MAG: hypothetical protein P8016_12305 [Sedimentisphaerales bacterium]